MTEFAIERLLANLRTQLPGALDGTLRLEIFNTVSTFCRESNTWQETQSFNTKVGKQLYEVTAEAPDAYYNVLLNLEAYDPTDENGEVTTPIPIAAWFDAPTSLKLRYVPTEVQRLRGTFSVVPRATDRMDQYPAIPEAFWDKYHDAFIEGVLSRMMSQPAKPYSNERLGIFHGRRFKAATSMAKNDKYNGDVRGGQNWSFPQVFTRRSVR
jgi:hypothetical protein